ncbi:MAG: class I SAM-dependent methyltransferase [Candidatus Diapherotrites archaeon]|uniref:Class I SAM-dependent methyltransferase n=1 Tax=Candidatus Iainarchaeum sp. TaxID=3101447 RepID=A0A8T3YP41_9ARCH|nr:class I SAM-dependent methyltransferase [Candidatus Diapherotrites archaeon]
MEGDRLQSFVKETRQNRELLAARIKALVPEPGNAVALEIGPGTSPLIHNLPFRERIFLDQSPKIVQGLRAAHPTAEVLHGDIRNPPSFHAGKISLAVAAEVFGHVEPHRRIGTLRKIARMADAILIVDYRKVSPEEFRRKTVATYLPMRNDRKALIRSGMLMGNPKAFQADVLDITREVESLLARDPELASLETVDPEPMRKLLLQEGFHVEVTDHGEFFVLSAKKP